MPTPATDHYSVLEISRTATDAEIRVAYRRLAKEHHPDANPGPEAEARMRRINEAWDVLRNAAKRSDYDRLLPRPAVRSVRRQPPPRAAAPRERPQARWFEGEDVPRSEARPTDAYTGDIAINWYKEIGVREDAPKQEILKALSKLAASMSGADISASEFARRRATMREAWAVLGDQYLRAAYDRARRAHPENSPDRQGSRQSPSPEAHSPAAPTPPPGYRLGPIRINQHLVDKGASLCGADLRGAELRGLDLAGIDLSGAKLQGADFEAASLRKANLTGADLSGANLRFADLSNADATAAALRQANLEGAALNATRFFRANLVGASLSGAVGPGINLDFADLARADFSGAKITVQLIERGQLNGTILPDGSRSA